jgi:hypothetical protein
MRATNASSFTGPLGDLPQFAFLVCLDIDHAGYRMDIVK